MAVPFVFLFFLSLFLLIFKFVYTNLWIPWSLQSHFKKLPLTGPPYRIFTGNSKEVTLLTAEAKSKPIPSGDNPHEFVHRVAPHFYKQSRAYGKTFLYWFGSKPVVATSDPSLIREALKSKSFDRIGHNEQDADADAEAHRFLHHPPPPPSSSKRRRDTSETAANGGKVSTGRKDRHSKVCTAKGPRDRRVSLSVHTAIQFYDVQDRLGFDRPSKAVDWLIKQAKTSIDELAQLPPWDPADAIRNAAAKARVSPSPPPQQPQQLQFGRFGGVAENESSFLPASMNSDSIADTIKSFFPVVGSSTEAPPHHQLMHNYHHHHQPPDLLSRTNSQNQDLRLSLQPFPDGPPSLLHHHHSVAEPVLFYGQSNPLGYDASTGGWEQQSIQRLVAWNSGGANDTGNNGGGRFVFAPPPPNHPTSTTSFQPVLGQGQLYSSQRSPLQPSYSPMIRAWFDPTHHHHQSISTDDLNLHHHNHMPPPLASGEFSSGFRIPARLQGQEEEQHDGLNNKPSSASRH